MRAVRAVRGRAVAEAWLELPEIGADGAAVAGASDELPASDREETRGEAIGENTGNVTNEPKTCESMIIEKSVEAVDVTTKYDVAGGLDKGVGGPVADGGREELHRTRGAEPKPRRTRLWKREQKRLRDEKAKKEVERRVTQMLMAGETSARKIVACTLPPLPRSWGAESGQGKRGP